MNVSIQPKKAQLPFAEFLLDAIEQPAFCLAEDAAIVYFNEAFCRLIQYSREELSSTNLAQINPEFSLVAWKKQWQSIRQQKKQILHSQYRTKNNCIFVAENTYVYTETPEKKFCCVSLRKLTQQDLEVQPENSAKLADTINNLNLEVERLEQSKTKLSTAVSVLHGTLDSAAYGIISVSYDGEVLSYNQKFVQMWQIPETLTLTKNEACRSFFDSKLKNPEVFHQSVWQVSRESKAETYDILELKDGRVFAQYSKPQELEDKIIGRVWSVWDITEFKQRTEEKLQQTEEPGEQERIREAKYISEVRSRFLSTLCHQFRSSLNIISFSNSLLKRYLNKWGGDSKIPYLDNIQTAIEQITNLLDELLLVGKSENGKVKFEPVATDVQRFCHDLIAKIQPLSDSKEQTINFIYQGNCPTAEIDCFMLEEILTNLLTNAFKYSPDGSQIDFELFCQEETQKVVFQIKDKGIGISQVDQQRLFEPFFRGDNVDDVPGTGLGLAIVKNLVNAHGGTIEVNSKVNKGTTFTVNLPLQ